MTAPVPPDGGPQPAEGPAAADPWAPPGPVGPAAAPAAPPGPIPGQLPGLPPGVPYWPAYPLPAPAPQPRNGMGIAALVLGIVGVVLGVTIVLFWLSWLPALLAVVFGAVALGYVRRGLAANRAMALAGVVLGVTGLLVSVGTGVFVVSRVQEAQQERRQEADAARARSEAATRSAQERLAREKARIEAEQQKEAADLKARSLSFGQSYTYPDGLTVTLAAPEPYTPRGLVGDVPPGARVVQLRLTVVNTGPAEVSLYGSGMPTVKDAKGNLVFMLIDGSGRMKLLGRSLAAGAQADGLTAYALPGDGADPFTVRFDRAVDGRPRAVTWTGSAG
ncbi:DUF4190 domain-containing protein [Kitasatospora sp. NPDC018619]|uniref:DUF4190 domain-containing protein n=1 Tax=unclassified Kitasatospora TaxID=2633591 RepID=UPI00379008D6